VGALFPSLQGYLGARLRAIHQSVMDFESGVARLPGELRDLLGSLRQELDGVLAQYEEQLVEARGDEDVLSRIDTRYLSFATLAAYSADLLTMGTDPDELPSDLHAILVELFGPRPDGHVIVLRATESTTFQTYPHWRPEQMRPGTDLMSRLQGGDNRELWLVSVFDIPRSFRYATLGQLLVIGHELAHAQDAVTNFGYRQAITNEMQLPAESEADEAINALVVCWLDEVLADLASVRRFGPAAVLVFAEYARLVQAYGYEIPRVVWVREFAEHPPAEVRLHFMFRALDALRIGADALAEIAPALAAWKRLADVGSVVPGDALPELAAADGLVRGVFSRIQAQAASLVPAHQAYTEAGFARARVLAEQFAEGLAPSDRIDDDLRSTPVDLADLFNAAAIVRWSPRLLDQLMTTMGVMTDEALSDEHRRARALRQLDELLARAIEGQRLRRAWPKGLDK